MRTVVIDVELFRIQVGERNLSYLDIIAAVVNVFMTGETQFNYYIEFRPAGMIWVFFYRNTGNCSFGSIGIEREGLGRALKLTFILAKVNRALGAGLVFLHAARFECCPPHTASL